MGGSGSKWRTPGSVKKSGTTLIEISIPHLRDAHTVIGMQPEAFTPVVVVPDRIRDSCCCSCCFVQIPDGFSTIVTKCGAEVQGDQEDGSFSAGGHCFMPWYSISRLVSKQRIVFDVPVKECRTADWIWVNIDVVVVIEIAQATTFVHRLGPEKLDDLLRAHQEEFLRDVVGNTHVQDIFDLRDTNMTEQVAAMNKDFEKYGVVIHNVTVRNVQIPQKMAQDFEDKTLYESKTVESKMQQQSDRTKLNNEEALQKLREECDNKRMAAEMEHVTTCAQVTKEVQEVMANAESAIKLMQAQRKTSVQDTKVNAGLEHAKLKAELVGVKQETAAQMEVEEGKLEAEATAYEAQRRAAAKMQASAKICEGKKAMALAEGAASDAFAAKRHQDEELLRLRILECLAENPNVRIVTSIENNTGLAPGNSLVSQVAQQGMEALRMKFAEVTATSAGKLDLGKVLSGGLVRPVPQMTMKSK
mmetsp:Transcript_16059/g.34721  ORF Transcript_16059/g.34721 Transcript_16059/m.34721 type:complete len:473 (+) Transcript_16059:166-1584(+)|eukprot:CAMPEP_0206438724 /NCGR_PEP_ID=MMETSP0324_2-20121206/11804_1 /ASSEMBLY_ACC=CAM_ASM_000836 /TAXON_ID=2866 /ORGANISM="Crypthecodinium cohnii, Strain Seligo" /LENGTH=472 /DNA_ID=CAMNT_0053906245 /DNA_START=139 /DNA_END=1560 /DNA_ORIENTATION=+